MVRHGVDSLAPEKIQPSTVLKGLHSGPDLSKAFVSVVPESEQGHPSEQVVPLLFFPTTVLCVLCDTDNLSHLSDVVKLYVLMTNLLNNKSFECPLPLRIKDLRNQTLR